MTVEYLLEQARKKAEKDLLDGYRKFCRDFRLNEAQFKDFISSEKEDGNYESDMRHNLFMNIMETISKIRRDDSISDTEKNRLIDGLKKSHEYIQVENNIMSLFAKHFVKYKDAYLK